MTDPLPPEHANAIQTALLQTPTGISGSGFTRYAAAMYFYKQGKISPELLEIYRRCCKWDDEDPRKLAEHEGIELRELPQ